MTRGYMRPLTPEREEHRPGSKIRSLVIIYIYMLCVEVGEL